jgi:PhnB protein
MRLHPHLNLRDTPRAMDWYKAALGAREVLRYTGGGRVVYAEMAIGDTKFSLSEENAEWHNHSPESLGGSPVRLTLELDDAHGVARRMQELGAKLLVPVEDQFYGERQGRLQDPFGHIWLLTQKIEDLSPEEVQRRIDNYKP